MVVKEPQDEKNAFSLVVHTTNNIFYEIATLFVINLLLMS